MITHRLAIRAVGDVNQGYPVDNYIPTPNLSTNCELGTEVGNWESGVEMAVWNLGRNRFAGWRTGFSQWTIVQRSPLPADLTRRTRRDGEDAEATGATLVDARR